MKDAICTPRRGPNDHGAHYHRAHHRASACAGLSHAAGVAWSCPIRPAAALTSLAALLSQGLEQRLKQPFVLDYRPGAASAIAATYVARAPGDGYTILYATSTTMAVNVSVHKKLNYDPTKDLTPVAMIADAPFILVVNASLPIKSIADLVAYAKTKPLSYASNGPGGAAHLFAELMKTMLKIDMTHIPYKGNAPALNDVVAGHVSHDVRRCLGIGAARARRQAARARRHHGAACADGARISAARGSRSCPASTSRSGT